jgi:multiple sugar transport system ATP-binding protein
MNLLDAVLHLDGDPHITISGQRLDVLPSVLDARPALRAHDGQEVVVGIRPETLDDAALVDDPDDARTLDAVVDLREGLGSEVVAHARIDAKAPAIAIAIGGGTEEPLLEEADGVQLVARLDPKTTVQVDRSARFVVDLEALHFFDSATGLAISDQG